MRISSLLAGERSTLPALPNFDSTTVFVRATARYLRGEEFQSLGMIHPTRGYPAVVVGSSNGAGVYLAAMPGVPWLPQTSLVPIRRDMDPDAIRENVQWGVEHAGPFLEANPDVAVHQMHDPNQDRLMSSGSRASAATTCVDSRSTTYVI